jgi:hypothetical protein
MVRDRKAVIHYQFADTGGWSFGYAVTHFSPGLDRSTYDSARRAFQLVG